MSTLRAFEATARLGSVTRAAAELGRTHGAVSRQIRSLQEAAGFALFDKAGTGLRLNARGEALLRVVAGALDGLEEGWGRLLDEARGPVLHVACSASFAMRWLVPRLADFQQRHPGVRLRLSMTTAREVRFEGAELVIAWDRGSYPPAEQARAILFGPVAVGPVCAPFYPVRMEAGRLRMPVRIAHEYTDRAWDGWAAESGCVAAWEGELRFPHTHLCIGAALAGLGVAVAEQRLVAEDVAAGRLVAPCGFTALPERWGAVPFSDSVETGAGREFVTWLAGALD
ncbi:LysR substrate-binding domain-containing protein [Roseomonas gilardii subsp. gilardii]|uniref:LysR substrate-binding domain-containing protein n=1 Tax=Roseomonas gilardii TaxID=257708 RepID=UPI001FF785E1|nr:LysR substrate-binding domain-containing protein [Roseomonas gilardii]UPG72797.1 LysR substrate-binding domain-containing protein [Roseomonas gilardii subsp. gilardii]